MSTSLYAIAPVSNNNKLLGERPGWATFLVSVNHATAGVTEFGGIGMQLEGVQPSLTGLLRLRMFSQDYVLGYFQPSLWDWAVALVNGSAIDLRQRSDLRVYAAKAVVGLRPSFSAHVSEFPARGTTNTRVCGFH
jgi:hypothetical protein